MMLSKSHIPTSYEPIARFSKLEGPNYQEWSFQMKMALQSRSVWQCCKFVSIESYLMEVNPKAGVPTNAEITKWQQKNLIAIALIGQCVTFKFVSTVESTENACFLWEKLKEDCKVFKNASEIALKSQFYNIRMFENETPLRFLDRVLELVYKLDCIGSKVEDKEICMRVIASLPEKYSSIKNYCLMLPEKDLSTAYLK